MSKYVIDSSTLTSIADAVRTKGGTTEPIVVCDIPTAITNLPSGGGGDLPEEAFVISGDCEYLNYNGHWDWFFNKYGNKILLQPTAVTSWMKNSGIENFQANAEVKTNAFFCYMNNLKIVSGKITAENRVLLTNIFNFCNNLKDIPINTYTIFQHNSGTNMTQAFNCCYSLRTIPQVIMPYLNGTICTSMFAGCSSLDEIKNFQIHTTYNYNSLNQIVKDCGRLKSFTFSTDNGIPYIAEWKTHTLDFSIRTGWNYTSSEVIGYNSGITADKEVRDDASYQLLKNDPDWFTCNYNYSRYNHDSAVATINSLPDTSAYLATAGGTNTIKFKGQAGASTDGGAISTLTEEEIAVAAAKGWTVTLV